MQLVIIAGGKGTRLLTKCMPKAMVKVGDYSIIEYQIMLAKHYSITDIIILTGYKSKQIIDYFGDGSKMEVKITYIQEPYPLGTAGSVKLLQNIIKERFMVFYGDLFMWLDLNKFIQYDSYRFDCIATLLVHPNNHPFDSDLIEVDKFGDVVSFHSKPHNGYYKNLTSAGVYILDPKIFNFIPFGIKTDFGKDVFPKMIGNMLTYKSIEYCKDIGTPERLIQAIEDNNLDRLKIKNKCIFLDRDGIINKYVGDLKDIDDFWLIEGVAEAIKKINNSEYLAIVVTNQPGIAKGYITEEELQLIHNKMETLLGEAGAYLDDIYYCPHHQESGFEGEVKKLKVNCDCRKPKPGMLIKASKKYDINLKESWMIGDNEIDIRAGKKAGCKTIWVNETQSFKNLLDAVDFIFK